MASTIKIRSNEYMAVNGNKYDILKLLLAILIVAIHSTVAGMVFRPVLRLAVPLFFIISSYLFFLKQSTLSTRKERCHGLRKYAKRILMLYLFWFVLLLPCTIYYREWYVDFGPEKLLVIARSFFFGSTFIASWFLMASLMGVAIVWLLASWKMRNGWIIGSGAAIYVLCCLVSNYNEALKGCPHFLEAYQTYVNLFTLPFNSFPCSILFIGIGKLLAERQFAPSGKMLWCVLGVSMVLLYVEFFITQHYFKAYYDDCFFMLPATCTCIFMLIGQSRPCKMNVDTKKLRSYSTVIYCCHGTILSLGHSLEHLILNGNNGIKAPSAIVPILLFLIAIALSVSLAEIIMTLEHRRHLGWLRYSH